MSKLLFDTLKYIVRVGKTALTYTHAKRQDLRKETGLLHTILTGEVSSNQGSRFMNESEQLKLFSARNSGLLLDGCQKRMSLEESFKHLLLVAPTGGGKTTKFIIPNIFSLAESNNSIVVTDPSGEIFAQTSGYMQSKGYEVLKFDPTDPDHSIFFNPLRFVISYSSGEAEIDQVRASLLASTLVASTLTGKDDAFWKASAESLIEFAISCLKDTPRNCHNLYNIFKILEAITPDGRMFEKFFQAYVHDIDLNRKWTSIVSSPSKTFDNQLATARTALKYLENKHIAKMLSKNSIDFKALRRNKTILYLTFPVNESRFYNFILNIFYTQLFYELMAEIPSKKDLPVFILYDEFGHSKIPDFDIVITNIRKYKVSLSLVLQSISQLESQYGKDRAKTIFEGGVSTKLFYAGASLETAKDIERMMGLVIRDSYSTARDSDKGHRQEFNLLNADEIRTLDENKAILITGNKKPALLNIKPFYLNGRYKKNHKFGEAYIALNSYYKYNLCSVFDDL